MGSSAFTSFFISEKSRTYYQAKGVLKQIREDEPRDAWYFRVRNMAEPYEISVDPDMANADRLTFFIKSHNDYCSTVSFNNSGLSQKFFFTFFQAYGIYHAFSLYDLQSGFQNFPFG